MEIREALDTLGRLLDESKTAVLATVDKEGKPRMRWMTPSLVDGQEGSVFAVTSPKFQKAVQVSGSPDVEWMIQSRSLNEVMNVRGKMEIIDNPSFKSEVIQSIGGNLQVFWRVNKDASALVVLETRIEELVYFRPLDGERSAVSFPAGGKGDRS
ncbi:MAG: pyridoxamine 5'-phosphate oxidase family protein [Spirochaetales bacterium]|nr:pyridoxamine 5'-phosphate oxidase family protein [Spirochaetales bacterium]MCF7939434.1 pyridoxamine 5'-phosphate oxidase family protein [Spirochaetales bacterium]